MGFEIYKIGSCRVAIADTEEKSLVALLSGGMAERVLRHEYDCMGNRVRSILPGGEIAEFTPNSSGHEHQLSFSAGPDQPERIISAFERDALNRETLRTQGPLCSRRTYDPLSRITRVYTGSLSSREQLRSLDIPLDTNPLVSKKFQYDANGELITSNDIFSGLQEFSYDSLGRITSVRHQLPGQSGLRGASAAARSRPEALLPDETFRYDPAGNLYSIETESGGSAYGDQTVYSVSFDNTPRKAVASHVRHNRVESVGGVAFVHDARGRVVEKSCATTGSRWRYAYDSDNRLTEVRTISASGTAVTRFGYDALGRRATKFDGANETLFVWDGLRLLQEERGASVSTYFYEQGGYAPLARVDGPNRLFPGRGGASLAARDHCFYYHCTPAGLPEDVTDSDGNVVWRGRHTTWGKLVCEHTTSHTPEGFTQPFRMQGQYDDGDTGLYYNTFRYYDPDAGMFTAEDPIGLSGGDNLYLYAPNPMAWADPLGLLNWLDAYREPGFYAVYEAPDINAGSGYLGGGISVSGHVAAIGGSLHLGMIRGGDGQWCVYFKSCTRFGPGFYFGVGLEAIAGLGSCASTEEQLSGKTAGGFVDLGWAYGFSGSVSGNENGGEAGGGRLGAAVGVATGGEICETHIVCW